MVRKTVLFLLLFLPVLSFGQGLYKVITTRAAPGQLQHLITVLAKEVSQFNKNGNNNAYLLRHSQGDQWDLLLVVPVMSYQEYYSSAKYRIFEKQYGDDYFAFVARQEEAFASGPAYDLFEKYFAENSLFHIEMFVSLPGKQRELKKEREMENMYLEETSRKPNFIFTKESGFEFDIFTIGAYKSLIEYANGGNQPLEVQERAALKSGFKSAADIGFYLRSLIDRHHDTLANKVPID